LKSGGLRSFGHSDSAISLSEAADSRPTSSILNSPIINCYHRLLLINTTSTRARPQPPAHCRRCLGFLPSLSLLCYHWATIDPEDSVHSPLCSSSVTLCACRKSRLKPSPSSSQLAPRSTILLILRHTPRRPCSTPRISCPRRGLWLASGYRPILRRNCPNRTYYSQISRAALVLSSIRVKHPWLFD
jgi:hypothetical protein